MTDLPSPAQLIFWSAISVNPLIIFSMAPALVVTLTFGVAVIVESFKPKPPVFLGPKQNLRLQQKIDDRNLINELFPDGWSWEENEDGTISAYCRATGDLVCWVRRVQGLAVPQVFAPKNQPFQYEIGILKNILEIDKKVCLFP